jgi:magnesium-transporting ATPase (P-type)
MNSKKEADKKKGEDLGYIEAVRRVSGIKLSKEAASGKNTKDAAEEQIYIEAIRRVSGVSLAGGNSKEFIAARREASVAKIQVERGLSSAEIGVIEGVRRLSGINAALHEMGEAPAKRPLKTDQISVTVGPDGKLKAPGNYEMVPTGDVEKGKLGAADHEKKDNGLGDKEWHVFTESDLFKELATGSQGLSSAEAAVRLEKYGLNEITPAPTTHWLIKLFIQLVGGFQLMMWFGSILCFIVYGLSNQTDVQTLALAIVLIFVVIATTIFQSYQVCAFCSIVYA